MIDCEKTRLSQEEQLNILRNWRKNKGVPVKKSHTKIKLFEE